MSLGDLENALHAAQVRHIQQKGDSTMRSQYCAYSIQEKENELINQVIEGNDAANVCDWMDSIENTQAVSFAKEAIRRIAHVLQNYNLRQKKSSPMRRKHGFSAEKFSKCRNFGNDFSFVLIFWDRDSFATCFAIGWDKIIR